MSSNSPVSIVSKEDVPDIVANQTFIEAAIARTRYGRFLFNTRDRIVGWTIALEGAWEGAEADFMIETVGPGDIAIDVGANLGWFTVILAKQVGALGKVFAFEPEPLNFQLLKDNIALNLVGEQAVALNTALWDTNEGLRLELSEVNLGDHQPRSTKSESSGEEQRRTILLPSRCLDEVLEKEKILEGDQQIRLIKMDCQGAETRIFRAGAKTLEKTQFLMCEYEPRLLQASGTAPHEFVSIMQKNFKEFRRLDSIADIWPDYKPIEELAKDVEKPLNRRGYTNYVFRRL